MTTVQVDIAKVDPSLGKVIACAFKGSTEIASLRESGKALVITDCGDKSQMFREFATWDSAREFYKRSKNKVECLRALEAETLCALLNYATN